MRPQLLCALAFLCGADVAHAQALPASPATESSPGQGASQPTPPPVAPPSEESAVPPPSAPPEGVAGHYQGYPGYEELPAGYSEEYPEGYTPEPNAFSPPTATKAKRIEHWAPPRDPKLECPHCPPEKVKCWITTDYNFSWFKPQRLATPLLTTGSIRDNNPGAIGQPGTAEVYGNKVEQGMFTGFKAEVGTFMDCNQCWSLEWSGLYLFPNHTRFRAASDGAGNPLLTRPTFNLNLNQETAFIDAFPNIASGSATIDSWSELYGTEVNVAYHICVCDQVRAGLLGGVRYLHLSESLTDVDQVTPLVPNVLRFLGAAVNPPNSFTDFDRFRTFNNFYGVQLGGRIGWEQQWFSASAYGKLGLGVTAEDVEISGGTTLFTPTGSRSVPGGILALPSNSGSHTRTVFGVLPELGVNVGIKLTPNVQLTAGYSFLYWNEVMRPGSQLNRAVNAATVPTDNSFGRVVGPPAPQFRFNGEPFWVNSLTIGLDFEY